jgi:AcrR family transcriptional regulator
MAADKLDRRVQKTRRLLQDALIALMTEKGFEVVTIQNILDTANVGRSTFYLHYDNKQDLLHSCFEGFNSLFEKYNMDVSKSGKVTGNFLNPQFTLNFFRFIERNHHLFKALMGKDNAEMFFNPVYNLISASICDALKAAAPSNQKDALRLELLTNYMTSALLGTLRWWINMDMPCTAEEVSSYFTRIALYDMRDLLNTKTQS